MSSIQGDRSSATETPSVGVMDMKLEVVVVPVSDVDRAKAFYEAAGVAAGRRLPGRRRTSASCSSRRPARSARSSSATGSRRPRRARSRACSSSSPTSRRRAPSSPAAASTSARCSTTRAGSSTTPGPRDGSTGRRRSAAATARSASFSDPDGNGWLLQEITTRLPGRVDRAPTSFGSANELAPALRRAAAAHGEHEARTGQEDADWPDWYAEYMVREQAGEELPT